MSKDNYKEWSSFHRASFKLRVRVNPAKIDKAALDRELSSLKIELSESVDGQLQTSYLSRQLSQMSADEKMAFDELMSSIDVFKRSNPPSPWLLEALLPTAVSGDYIANLEELYSDRWVPRYGLRKALVIWHCQSAAAIGLLWIDRVLSVWERVRKLTTG